MIERVFSGGQTGADQAALRAARAAGLTTGGVAPKGWKTEAGPAPWLADFGLTECQVEGYPARTEANVIASDGTVWFGSISSTGFRATHDAAVWRSMAYPFFIVYQGITKPSQVADWIIQNQIRTLNVAGNRESVSPGIGERVERFLIAVIRVVLARKDRSD
jgi:hypothetical protein